MAFIDLVQWAGTPEIFAWRYPETNLTTFTQLIVNESQEAVLFHKGKLLQTFGAGKHTLTTENIPLLENLFGIPFGGKNPFTAEVWFVNKVTSLDIKWGTVQPFVIRDPEFGIMAPVRGFGQFGIRIADAELFLVKLVGTLPLFTKVQVVDYFKGLLLSRATSVIARTIKEKKVSVLDITAHISELSDAMTAAMQDEFGKYGIELVNFYVSQISIPDDDPAIVKLRDSLSKRADMDLLNYTYQQGRTFDVLDGAANNEGMAGGVMGMGMGLGMGMGAGSMMGGMMQEASQHVRHSSSSTPSPQPSTFNQQPPQTCATCGGMLLSGSRFCAGCGGAATPAPQPASTQVACDKCGKQIPSNAKFCPFCGDLYNPCPACGIDLPDGATVCSGCGEKMPVKCRCGVKVAAEARFCSGCGTSMRKVCAKCGREATASELFCVGCGSKYE